MATTLSSPLSDPGGCLICQRLALAVVLVDLAKRPKKSFGISQLQRVSRDLIVHDDPGYVAIAGTIGSRNNSPETGITEQTITAVAQIMAENGSEEEIDKALSKR